MDGLRMHMQYLIILLSLASRYYLFIMNFDLEKDFRSVPGSPTSIGILLVHGCHAWHYIQSL